MSDVNILKCTGKWNRISPELPSSNQYSHCHGTNALLRLDASVSGVLAACLR